MAGASPTRRAGRIAPAGQGTQHANPNAPQAASPPTAWNRNHLNHPANLLNANRNVSACDGFPPLAQAKPGPKQRATAGHTSKYPRDNNPSTNSPPKSFAAAAKLISTPNPSNGSAPTGNQSKPVQINNPPLPPPTNSSSSWTYQKRLRYPMDWDNGPDPNAHRKPNWGWVNSWQVKYVKKKNGGVPKAIGFQAKERKQLQEEKDAHLASLPPLPTGSVGQFPVSNDWSSSSNSEDPPPKSWKEDRACNADFINELAVPPVTPAQFSPDNNGRGARKATDLAQNILAGRYRSRRHRKFKPSMAIGTNYLDDILQHNGGLADIILRYVTTYYHMPVPVDIFFKERKDFQFLPVDPDLALLDTCRATREQKQFMTCLAYYQQNAFLIDFLHLEQKDTLTLAWPNVTCNLAEEECLASDCTLATPPGRPYCLRKPRHHVRTLFLSNRRGYHWSLTTLARVLKAFPNLNVLGFDLRTNDPIRATEHNFVEFAAPTYFVNALRRLAVRNGIRTAYALREEDKQPLHEDMPFRFAVRFAAESCAQAEHYLSVSGKVQGVVGAWNERLVPMTAAEREMKRAEDEYWARRNAVW